MNAINHKTMIIKLLIMTICLCNGALNIAAAKETESVRLPKQEWYFISQDNQEESENLREAVIDWQKAWTQRDVKACRRLLTEHVLIVSQNQAQILSGREAVMKALPKEWEYYETDDHGASALQSTLRRVNVEMQGNAALIHYYMDVTGGNRWSFEDTAAFTQIFVRNEIENTWQLAFSADVWNLDYDTESGKAGQPVFAYDYAMPVQDLARAVKFYQPLLGDPEALTKNLAVFEVKESRLYLVTREISDELTQLRAGLPNGWAILTPPNFEQARENGEKQGVKFIGTPQDFGGLKVLYGYEPSGNLIALARSPTDTTIVKRPELHIAETLSGDKLPAAIATADNHLWTTWLKGETDDFLQQCTSNIVLLDATRTRTQGWASGQKNVRKRLLNTFGNNDLDNAKTAWQTRHPFAKLNLTEGHTRRVGAWVVIARHSSGIGATPWQRRSEALDTRIFETESAQLTIALTVSAAPARGIALEFDYAGIPATKAGWKATDKALQALTGNAANYHDEQWKGFWGERAVLGMFETELQTDKMPRNQEASTYLSLLVSKLETAMTHLKSTGAKFPIIPAINDKAGISKYAGYNQVLFTDSEGNGVVLTEYTGRSKRQK